MKKIKILSIFILILMVTSTVSNAITLSNEECSWYVKRNGNKRPIFSKSQECISEYGGYYLDLKVNDTSQEKVLYLTFDLGYENGNAKKILDILNKESVPAAFFILDNMILKNADLVTAMAESGHLICNHTKNHKNLSSATAEEIEKNLTALEHLYEEKTGKTMSKYFRFPEGKYSLNTIKAVNDLGYKSIFWSFAYDDWDNTRQPSPKYAIKKILDNTHNGAVILLHPTSSTNAEILPKLITEWRKSGYTFGTLDRLTDSL